MAYWEKSVGYANGYVVGWFVSGNCRNTICVGYLEDVWLRNSSLSWGSSAEVSSLISVFLWRWWWWCLWLCFGSCKQNILTYTLREEYTYM